MKVTKIVSDVSKKEIDNPIEIHLKKPGYSIEYPKGVITNELVLDISEDELSDLISSIRFRPIESGPTKHLEVV